MRFFEVSDSITKFGVASVTIVNIFFIFLTVFHVKRIVGTYKKMVLIFASMGIVFSSWEIIARPFVHNYDKGFIFFSLNTWLGASQKFLLVAISIYASFYLLIVSLLAVQFLFRYATLVKPKYARKFSGNGIFIWLSYSFTCGLIYGSLLYFFGLPDDYSDEYMKFIKEEILQNYGLAVKELPRIVMIPYVSFLFLPEVHSLFFQSADGSIRWRNILFLVVGGVDMILQYIIIVYCGIRMHLVMRKEFSKSSIPNKKLQKQFFKALIVQIVVPTFLFVFPAAFVLLSPLFNIKMSLQTGWIYTALSLYPPIDTIAFMLLVSEYRKVTKGTVIQVCNKTDYFRSIFRAHKTDFSKETTTWKI
ncbi:hypothetical protein CRE_12473 [Caenorhabditis remanei]|uniref:Seven TM Receptor n=1 Tax=Caenorhabditis remanei TaxID=31234 RepID=E3M733_CAERE|nr:hypothetical protein CRE_12473 [Caenorhabditis remanei]